MCTLVFETIDVGVGYARNDFLNLVILKLHYHSRSQFYILTKYTVVIYSQGILGYNVFLCKHSL